MREETILGVGLITPNAVIDMLAIALCTGNNRLVVNLSKVIEVHE